MDGPEELLERLTRCKKSGKTPGAGVGSRDGGRGLPGMRARTASAKAGAAEQGHSEQARWLGMNGGGGTVGKQ